MLKILIVDDHEMVRSGLKSLLSSFPQYEVVAEANNGRQAVDLAKRYKPDLVLMDLRLPGMSGIEATQEITTTNKEVRVLILTATADDESLLEAIAAGASGYVEKQIDSKSLIRAIDRVGNGQSFLDSANTKIIFKQLRKDLGREEEEAFSPLSDQELRILALLTEGMKNKEIAQTIYLSHKTVRNYVYAICGKLKVRNRVEAAAFGMSHKINRNPIVIEFRKTSREQEK